nr:FAD-dependent oxidoreductase [bacterium]
MAHTLPLGPVVVIGASAAGMAAAVAARRVDPKREVILLERMPYYAFASCGLPEVIKGNLPDITPLVHRNPQELGEKLGITVLLQQEARRINHGRRKLQVRNLLLDSEYELDYSALVLATGARPAPPGRTGYFTLRYPHELDKLLGQLRDNSCRRVNVSGGGVLGLTLVDALLSLGKEVHLYTRDTLLASFPPEISLLLVKLLEEHQVELHLQEQAPPGNREELTLLAHGVEPHLPAGLRLGRDWDQGIPIDRSCRTEVEGIFACGDCARPRYAGRRAGAGGAATANRQGKVAGANAAGGKERYNGVFAVLLEIAGLEVGRAGFTLAQLKQERQPVASVSGNFRLLPPWLGAS